MNRKGQALVEFILILPLIIAILFSIIDFGMILNKKSEMDNISVDIVSLMKKGDSIEKIRSTYPDLKIEIDETNGYRNLKIEEDVDIMTPGLNLVLGDPYKVIVERVIPNEKTE